MIVLLYNWLKRDGFFAHRQCGVVSPALYVGYDQGVDITRPEAAVTSTQAHRAGQKQTEQIDRVDKARTAMTRQKQARSKKATRQEDKEIRKQKTRKQKEEPGPEEGGRQR